MPATYSPTSITDLEQKIIDHCAIYDHPAVEALAMGADRRTCIEAMLGDYMTATIQLQPIRERIRQHYARHEQLQTLLEDAGKSNSGNISAAATLDEIESMPFAELRKRARYSGTVYNGGFLRQPGGKFIVDLRGVEFDDPARQPSLKDHKADRPIGFHRPVIDLQANTLRVEDGRIALDNPWSREILSGIPDDHPWQASIRGNFQDARAYGKDEVVSVNGRTFRGPLIVAHSFQWRETSWTGLGADQDTARFEIEVI